MKPLRRRFQEFMQLRNLSEKTQTSYLSALIKLSKHYGKSPEVITQDQIFEYVLFLSKEQNQSFSSCNVALSAFKCFYNQFMGNGTIVLRVPSRKRPKKLPVVYSKEEVRRVINSVANLKYRTMIMMAYGAGLRISEIIHLQVCDIDGERKSLIIHGGKGKKDRHGLLSDRMLEELKQYYRIYRPESWLFYSARNKDKPLSRDSLSRAFKKAKQKAGIKKTGGMHTLRHCFATHLLEDHVDIKTVQHLLGHADVSTTMVYLHVTKKLIYSVKSPLDSLEDEKSVESNPFSSSYLEEDDE